MGTVLGILSIALICYLWGFSDGVNTGKGNSIVREDREGN